MKIDIPIVENTKLYKTIDVSPKLKVLERGESKGAKSMFRILSQKDGDTRIVWDSNSFDEIVEAKEIFDELVASGLVPYRVDIHGRRTPMVMDQFDPNAEEVLFAPIAMAMGG